MKALEQKKLTEDKITIHLLQALFNKEFTKNISKEKVAPRQDGFSEREKVKSEINKQLEHAKSLASTDLTDALVNPKTTEQAKEAQARIDQSIQPDSPLYKSVLQVNGGAERIKSMGMTVDQYVQYVAYRQETRRDPTIFKPETVQQFAKLDKDINLILPDVKINNKPVLPDMADTNTAPTSPQETLATSRGVEALATAIDSTPGNKLPEGPALHDPETDKAISKAFASEMFDTASINKTKNLFTAELSSVLPTINTKNLSIQLQELQTNPKMTINSTTASELYKIKQAALRVPAPSTIDPTRREQNALIMAIDTTLINLSKNNSTQQATYEKQL